MDESPVKKIRGGGPNVEGLVAHHEPTGATRIEYRAGRFSWTVIHNTSERFGTASRLFDNVQRAIDANGSDDEIRDMVACSLLKLAH